MQGITAHSTNAHVKKAESSGLPTTSRTVMPNHAAFSSKNGLSLWLSCSLSLYTWQICGVHEVLLGVTGDVMIDRRHCSRLQSHPLPQSACSSWILSRGSLQTSLEAMPSDVHVIPRHPRAPISNESRSWYCITVIGTQRPVPVVFTGIHRALTCQANCCSKQIHPASQNGTP